MKHLWLIAAGGLLGAPVMAQEASADAGVRAAVFQALEERATPPAQPPRLPDAASDRAREVHAATAFGQKGEAERAAHELAGKSAQEHARRIQAEANGDGEHGAAAAEARSGNADSRAAAARERSNEAKGKGPQGQGGGNGHKDPNQPPVHAPVDHLAPFSGGSLNRLSPH